MSLLDEVRRLPGAGDLIALARAELPQKNDLCGAFTGLISLRAHGFAVSDQDDVALAAGTVLPESGPPSTPPGEAGRDDFRLVPASTRDAASAGTSATGLARAVERLSGGALAAVPACGEWTGRALLGLLDAAARLSRVAVIANVDTGAFAAHDTPQRALRDYLDTGVPPLWMSRWRVGHFVLVAGVLAGAEGALVAIMDTYPSLGERGIHLQPVEHAAAALRREGMTPGGVLLVVGAAEREQARAAVTGAGLRVELWDNGSPAP